MPYRQPENTLKRMKVPQRRSCAAGTAVAQPIPYKKKTPATVTANTCSRRSILCLLLCAYCFFGAATVQRQISRSCFFCLLYACLFMWFLLIVTGVSDRMCLHRLGFGLVGSYGPCNFLGFGLCNMVIGLG